MNYLKEKSAHMRDQFSKEIAILHQVAPIETKSNPMN